MQKLIKIIILTVCVFLLLLLFFGNKKVRIIGYSMGTTYSVVIEIPLYKFIPEAELKNQIDAVLRDGELRFSVFNPGSLVAQINELPIEKPYYIIGDLQQLLEKCYLVHVQTQGAFDPTVYPLVNRWGFGKDKFTSDPSAKEIKAIMQDVGLKWVDFKENTLIKHKKVNLDFSAIAKGFMVDKVAEKLVQLGYKNYLVEIGGEIYASYSNPKKVWKVGVGKPNYKVNDGQILGVLKLNNLAVATSGDYRRFFNRGNIRYSHIIDPRTGYPISNGVISVTVLAEKCVYADALATGLMVMGAEKAIELINTLEAVEAMVIVGDSERLVYYFSDNFKQFYGD